MRRVFDDKEIDAVTLATTNHWLALTEDGDPRGIDVGQGARQKLANMVAGAQVVQRELGLT